MKIRLILTGGTIDKKFNEVTGQLDYSDTHIYTMLKQGRSRCDLVVEKLMLLDSIDMTEEQHREIVRTCKNSPEDKIVITHGTYTMVQTARLLGESIQNKAVVLVGSMVPYVFGYSDALFNLGAAITAVQCVGKGVYITMNGKIFDWDKVQKSNELGEFQSA